MASKTAREGRRCLQVRSRSLQDGTSWPTRGPQEASKRAPRRQKSLILMTFLQVFGICFFSAFRRLKTAQEAPKIAHEASEMAP